MEKYYKDIELQKLIKTFFVEKDLHEIRKSKREELEKKLAYNKTKLKNLQKILTRALKKNIKSDIEVKDIILEKKLTIRENFKIEEELDKLKEIYSEEEYIKLYKIFISYSEVEKSILEKYFLHQKTMKLLSIEYYFNYPELKKVIESFSEIVAKTMRFNRIN